MVKGFCRQLLYPRSVILLQTVFDFFFLFLLSKAKPLSSFFLVERDGCCHMCTITHTRPHGMKSYMSQRKKKRRKKSKKPGEVAAIPTPFNKCEHGSIVPRLNTRAACACVHGWVLSNTLQRSIVRLHELEKSTVTSISPISHHNYILCSSRGLHSLLLSSKHTNTSAKWISPLNCIFHLWSIKTWVLLYLDRRRLGGRECGDLFSL